MIKNELSWRCSRLVGGGDADACSPWRPGSALEQHHFPLLIRIVRIVNFRRPEPGGGAMERRVFFGVKTAPKNLPPYLDNATVCIIFESFFSSFPIYCATKISLNLLHFYLDKNTYTSSNDCAHNLIAFLSFCPSFGNSIRSNEIYSFSSNSNGKSNSKKSYNTSL